MNSIRVTLNNEAELFKQKLLQAESYITELEK